jgi:hypothetical protein
MELLNQANLIIAIAGPIVLIVAINAVLQRGNKIRPLVLKPTPIVAAPVMVEPTVANREAANDDQHARAA